MSATDPSEQAKSAFEFTHERSDDLHTIRWVGDPELAGWARFDLWGLGTPRFVEQYGMAGGAGLLYPALLALVWHMTEGLQRFALPAFDGVDLCERNGRPYELVQWEYEIDWEQAEWPLRDRGFVPAEHLVAPVKRCPGAALAPVESWAELMSITPFGDQANTLCLFAVSPGARARDQLHRRLRGGSPPRVGDVVTAADDILAVITQEDEGLGLSSLVVHGREHLRREFPHHETLLSQRVAEYLTSTSRATTHEEWLSAVDRLTPISRSSPPARR